MVKLKKKFRRRKVNSRQRHPERLWSHLTSYSTGAVGSSLGANSPGPQIHHRLPSNVDLKKTWSCAPIPLWSSLIKIRGSFVFILHLRQVFMQLVSVFQVSRPIYSSHSQLSPALYRLMSPPPHEFKFVSHALQFYLPFFVWVWNLVSHVTGWTKTMRKVYISSRLAASTGFKCRIKRSFNYWQTSKRGERY